MKKLLCIMILVLAMSAVLQGCSAKNESAGAPETSSPSASERIITKELAYEGVYNYCHSTYDQSIAEDDPSMMYVAMGDESETEYQVIFRSYTGAFVYFYVDKASGITRMTEYVPALDIESEAGTIDLYDYLETYD